MAQLIDSSYFQELGKLAPEDVCRRAGCSYDSDKASYYCEVWENQFTVSPARQEVECSGPLEKELFDYLSLFVVHYLLGSKDIEQQGEWISEKDIPGGAAFFRGPHELPTSLICNRFENNLGDFEQVCLGLGGTSLALADNAFSFKITARISVALLYWRGDEDFPAESKLLFDRTIGQHLPLDIVYALAVGICKRIATAVSG